MSRAVFLDLGGTLIERGALEMPGADLALVPGCEAALANLAAAGFGLAVVCHHPGPAQGWLDEDALDDVADRLRGTARAAGADLLGFWYCPHHPAATVARYRADCTCRTPAPGLLLRAAQLCGLDLRASWAVGDTLDDVEAGRRVGCHTILIDNGGETEWREGAQRNPHYVVRDIREAARAIIARTPQPPSAAVV